VVLQDARSFRWPHDRSIFGRSIVSPFVAMAVGPSAVPGALPLARRTIRQMPMRAKVALIHVHDGPRLDLSHVCRASCIFLGTKDCLWCPVCPPVRPEGEGSSVAEPAPGASRSILPSTHGYILVGDHCAHVTAEAYKVLPVQTSQRAPTRPDPTEGEKGSNLARRGTTSLRESHPTDERCTAVAIRSPHRSRWTICAIPAALGPTPVERLVTRARVH